MHANRWPLSRAILGAVAVATALVMVSCSNPFVVDLQADSWRAVRYVNYGPVILTNVANRSGRPYQAAVITASCYNDQLESLTRTFKSEAFAIEPDEVIPEIRLEHVSGWPYFIDFGVYCRFGSYSEIFPAEPNPKFTAR